MLMYFDFRVFFWAGVLPSSPPPQLKSTSSPKVEDDDFSSGGPGSSPTARKLFLQVALCFFTRHLELYFFSLLNTFLSRDKESRVINSLPSGHPESNQGPSDICKCLQSDALPTELQPVQQHECSMVNPHALRTQCSFLRKNSKQQSMAAQTGKKSASTKRNSSPVP